MCLNRSKFESEIISKELPNCSPPLVGTDPERRECTREQKQILSGFHLNNLLLTQYLLHMYSDFIKKTKIARVFCEFAQSAFGNVLSTGGAEACSC